MLSARNFSIAVVALSCIVFSPSAAALEEAPAKSTATEAPKVGIRAFASTGRKAKAAAAKIETAFAEAWKAERTGDTFLGGRAPKYQSKESRRAKSAAAEAQKNGLTHIIDVTISKKRSTATIKLLLVDASGAVVGREKVTARKVTPKAFEKAAKALAGAIPAPPPPPPPPAPKEEEQVVETAPTPTADAVPQDPAPPAAVDEASDDGSGGGFGSFLAGTGLFFLGSGVTALAAGGAFTAAAIVGRDWENKAALNSGLRDEVNTGIFWISVSADVVLVAGVITTLVGVALLTTGLLIE